MDSIILNQFIYTVFFDIYIQYIKLLKQDNKFLKNLIPIKPKKFDTNSSPHIGLLIQNTGKDTIRWILFNLFERFLFLIDYIYREYLVNKFRHAFGKL